MKRFLNGEVNWVRELYVWWEFIKPGKVSIIKEEET